MADKTTATRNPNAPVTFPTPTPPAGGYKPSPTTFRGQPVYQGAGPGSVQQPTGDTSAIGVLMGMLSDVGLADLAQQAWQQWLDQTPLPLITEWVRSQPQYEAMYPGLNELRKQGSDINSEAKYNAYMQQARDLMHAAGLPQGMYDTRQDLSQLLLHGVSAPELQQRIQDYADAAKTADADTLSVLHRDYGIQPGSGALAAFYMDPDKALPLLEKQFGAAQVGGAALRTGYGATTQAQNEALYGQGVSAAQATQGFGQLAGEHELFSPLPGEQGDLISQDQQIRAQFLGDAGAQQAIERQAARRVAQFQGGGGFAGGKNGFALGAATGA